MKMISPFGLDPHTELPSAALAPPDRKVQLPSSWSLSDFCWASAWPSPTITTAAFRAAVNPSTARRSTPAVVQYFICRSPECSAARTKGRLHEADWPVKDRPKVRPADGSFGPLCSDGSLGSLRLKRSHAQLLSRSEAI